MKAALVVATFIWEPPNSPGSLPHLPVSPGPEWLGWAAARVQSVSPLPCHGAKSGKPSLHSLMAQWLQTQTQISLGPMLMDTSMSVFEAFLPDEVLAMFFLVACVNILK